MLKALSILLAGLALSVGSASAAEEMDGKKLFEANCSRCHGNDGTVSDYGRKLDPQARNLRAIAQTVSTDELRRIITHGTHDSAMTAKKYALDALQIEAVLEYISTFEYKPDLARGAKRFKEVCSSCHGMDGRANTGLGAKNLVYSQLDLSGIVHTMRYGRPGTLMTAKRKQLTNEEIANVANYVDSLRRMGDAAVGGKIYASKCASCHATPGEIKFQGNAASAAKPISAMSDYVLDLRIRHGRHIDRAGDAVGKLTPDDVQDIIAYVRQVTK